MALLAVIPEDSSPRVIVVKPEVPAPTPIRANGQKVKSPGPAYDPGLVFVLELATIIATRDDETVREVGKDVADALQSVIRDAKNVHHVALARTCYYLLKVLRSSNVSYLHRLLSSLLKKDRITISSVHP